MSFIRPEAQAVLCQYGPPAVLALLGGAAIWKGWTLLESGLWWAGVLLLALGVFLCLALFGTVERALTGWRGRRGAPGLVTIEEGRISYFAPEAGAVLALDALIGVDIVTTSAGPAADDLFWVLTDEAGQMAAIPNGAKGAAALLDTLGNLPGFDHMSVITAMSSTEEARFQIWRRGG